MTRHLQLPTNPTCHARLFWHGLPLPMFTDEEARRLASHNGTIIADRDGELSDEEDERFENLKA